MSAWNGSLRSLANWSVRWFSGRAVDRGRNPGNTQYVCYADIIPEMGFGMTLYCTTCSSMKDYETENKLHVEWLQRQAFVQSGCFFTCLDGALVREEIELDERELRLPYISVCVYGSVCLCVFTYVCVCVCRAQFCSKRDLSSFLSFSKFVLDCFSKLKTVLEISLSLILSLGFLHMHTISFWSVNHWVNVFFPLPYSLPPPPPTTPPPPTPLFLFKVWSLISASCN